jgi:hypothetical protein
MGVVVGDWQRAEGARVDAELRRVARGGGALRLALGEALDAMVQSQGHCALGFSSIEAYARERCGLGAGVVRKLLAMVRHLARLPRLRAALVEGTLGFSMVELLARHAAPESEAFFVGLARHATVAQMRKALRLDEPTRVDRARVHRTVDAEVAWLHEQIRMFAEAQAGTRANDVVWEVLLAEAAVDLAPWLDDDVPEWPAEDDEAPAIPAPAGGGAHRERASGGGAAGDDACSPGALDRRLVGLARELTLRDLRIGDLSLDLAYYGYPCAKARYAEDVLGMSLSALKAKQTLVRRLARFPELQHALEDGQVGAQAAMLLARVVTQQSVQAWVERAQARTVKHLSEEVRFVEMVARMSGGVPAGPPTAEQMAHAAEVERGVLSGQISHVAEAPMPDDPTAVRPEHMGRVELTFHMRADLAAEYRRVEAAWERAGRPTGDFVRFVALSFWRAWGHTLDGTEQAYGHIYLRDRYRCASPTCWRRDVTPHHLRFRSQGGGEEDDNLVALCTWCHLFGIHTWGSIKATGPASELGWRTPVLEVRGREVTWWAA